MLTSNAAPVLSLFQNKVKFLRKVMLISDEPLFSGQPPLVNTPWGGGGTPLYRLYRYVPPHRVGFLLRFGLKTGHFAHFGLESGMGIEGTTGVYKPIYRFNSK